MSLGNFFKVYYGKNIEGVYHEYDKQKPITYDVWIKVQNEIIPANRRLLSSNSNYFKSWFSTPTIESKEWTITVETEHVNEVKTLIDFLHYGKIIISHENVTNILFTADFLQIAEVKEFCLDFLRFDLNLTNCFTRFKYAIRFQSVDLKQVTSRFIKANFEQVIKNQDFQKLSKEDLMNILKINNNQLSEEKKFEAIICWIKHDQQNRMKAFSELFVFVKVDSLSCSFIKNVLLKEKLFANCILSLKSVVTSISKRVDLQKYAKFGKKLLGIGGKKTDRKVVEIFNPFDLDEVIYPDLPHPLVRHDAVRLDNVVYCFGGQTTDKKLKLRECWKLDLNLPQKTWEKVESMLDVRYDMASTHFRNLIITVGGGTSTLHSAEAYLPALNQWVYISSLTIGRCKHQLVNCNNMLYVLGGCDCEEQVMPSVECLSVLNQSWISCASMNSSRKDFAAVSYGNFIYAIGGSSKHDSIVSSSASNRSSPDESILIASSSPEDFLATVEKYDVRYNVWTYVANLNVGRMKHSAVVFHNKIYVVGGYTMNGNYIESYDPELDCWSIVKECNQQFIDFSLIVV